MYYQGDGWYGFGWHDHVVNVWDPLLAVALLLFAIMLYGVWRLWRGLWLDNFVRTLRTLHQQPNARLALRSQSAPPRSGVFQLSLLPLMLLASGLALLLAQAQQPDELSRPVTWALFVVIGSAYGAHAWGRRRGVGPLRNNAFAGAVSGMLVSFSLWTFYMAVDAYGSVGPVPAERLTARVPQLLWWTAGGSVVGAFLGAIRAQRQTNQVSVKVREASLSPANTADAPIVRDDVPARRQRLVSGGLVVGCVASLLFHLSAAPQLNQVVRLKHYYGWQNQTHRPAAALTLTMRSVDRTRADRLEFDPVTLSTATESSDDIAGGAFGRQRPSASQATKAVQANALAVVVPKRDIARGEPLSPRDFELVDSPFFFKAYARDLGAVTGVTALRDMPRGIPVRTDAVAPIVNGDALPAISGVIVESEPEFVDVQGGRRPETLQQAEVPMNLAGPANEMQQQTLQPVDTSQNNTRYTFDDVVTAIAQPEELPSQPTDEEANSAPPLGTVQSPRQPLYNGGPNFFRAVPQPEQAAAPAPIVTQPASELVTGTGIPVPFRVAFINGTFTVATVDPVGLAAGLKVGDRILAVLEPAGMSVNEAVLRFDRMRLVLAVSQPQQTKRIVTIRKGPGSLAEGEGLTPVVSRR